MSASTTRPQNQIDALEAMHNICNVLIELDGDVARCES